MRNAMSDEAIFKGEKTKAYWDRKLTIIFCDLCIKEINHGNRPGTHFKREGWLRLINKFEKETGKPYSRAQLKSRWDILKKDWKIWKKLKGKDTSLGWSHTKKTIDTSDDWWESRLKLVLAAHKFRTGGIDEELEGMLDQMFLGIVATGDNAWAPSLGALPSDFYEDGDDEIPEEHEGENAINNAGISSAVGLEIDGNNQASEHQLEPEENMQQESQKRKSMEAGCSKLRTKSRKSSKKIGGSSRLSTQIDKLCDAAERMSQTTNNLTTTEDPYGIRVAMKALNNLSNEVLKSSRLYFFALKLLLDKEKRTMFLELDEDLRVWWLNMEMEESSTFSRLLTP